MKRYYMIAYGTQSGAVKLEYASAEDFADAISTASDGVRMLNNTELELWRVKGICEIDSLTRAA